MSYLSTLKKSSVLDFDSLQKAIEEQNKPTSNKPARDERFWKPEVDKAGNAFAVIRFLPPAIVNGEPEDVLWVRVFDHGFQGPTGKWYIEKSLTTIKQEDPLSQFNSILWNSTEDDASPARKQARDQRRRLQFVSNILVVKDPKNPQNEGKVFLYQYGKKVFDKILSAMAPKIPGMPKLNPFDPVAGADFNLFIEKVAGYPNYDQSRFNAPAPLGSNEDIDRICPQAYSLKELISPDKFKSREELIKRLNEVMGTDIGAVIAAGSVGAASVVSTPSVVPAARVAAAKVVEDHELPHDSEEDDDDDLKEFKRLALGN